ncbi:MAG: gamma-glutamyltransferase [Caldimonas sp.]
MKTACGVISAGHDQAAAIAADMLSAGGNAVDAGVAATIALTVLHSEQVQLGGVAPMLVRMTNDRQTCSIEGAGRWPAEIDRERLEQAYRGRIPHGVVRTVVPAAPGAWIEALVRFGTMGFAELAEPARELAATGFAVHEDLVSSTTQFERYYRAYAENTRIWLPHDRPLLLGEQFKQPDLASTLGRLIDADRSAALGGGRIAGLQAVLDLFYRGQMADEMVQHVQGLGGWLSRRDLAMHHTPVVAATAARVFGGTLYSCGFWSQGPALSQALQILEHYGPLPADSSSPEFLHLVIEALNLALADREAHYGDEDFVAVPWQRLLSPEHARRQAQLIHGDRTLASQQAAVRTSARLQTPAAESSSDSAGAISLDTSVVAVIDAEGNVFACTPSDPSMDAPAVPGLGFVISTRGAQSFVHADHPSVLAPGKRPRVTACPMIFESAQGSHIAGGGPGGDFQLQAMAQVLAQRLVNGVSLREAVRAPRVYTQSAPASSEPHLCFPGRVLVESSASPAVFDGLTRFGHRTVHDQLRGNARPSICLVASSADGTDREAVDDPRRTMGVRIVPASMDRATQ